MRKFFGIKKNESKAASGVESHDGSFGSSTTDAPAAFQPQGDLAFLPPMRDQRASLGAGSHGGRQTDSTRGARRSTAPDIMEGLSMPGASRLAGLFDEEDCQQESSASFAAPSLAAARSAVAEQRPAAARATAGEGLAVTSEDASPKLFWSGTTRLFRLDEGGCEMVEVETGEGLDNKLFVGAIRAVDGEAFHNNFELIIYTAVRKRRRLRVPVKDLELQPLSGESVPFYDDTGIYWAMQLNTIEESQLIFRLIVALKALGAGTAVSVELDAGAEDRQVAAGSCTAFRVISASQLGVGEMREVPCEVPAFATCSQASQLPSVVDAQWGAGVGAALADLQPGSAALVAVSPGGQPRALRLDLARADGPVLLLEVLAEGSESPEIAIAAEPDLQQPAKSSIRERMAKLAAAGLPQGAVGASGPLKAAEAHETSVPSQQYASWNPFGPSTSISDGAGTQVGHPSAEIIRQYWAAVQENVPGTPYAYLGALPVVPGLSRVPGSAALPSQPKGSACQGPDDAATPLLQLSSAQHQGADHVAATHVPRFTSSFAPVGSLPLSELVGAIREVVRAEATPEGWQVERQKLERRASLLEEQLRATRTHQEQLREALRTQTATLHAQLAEQQMREQQMMAQQLRKDGERQMREWEMEAQKNSLEAELRQCCGEVQQLRLEHKGLQDRLLEANDAQLRAESKEAAATAAAASLPGAEARLLETSQATERLRQMLLAEVAGRASEAMAVSRGILACTYVTVTKGLPSSPGALVVAEDLSHRLRAACRCCSRALEQQLQILQAAADAWSPDSGRPLGLGPGHEVDWEAVESGALAELGPGGLPDAAADAMSAGASAALRDAAADSAHAQDDLQRQLAARDAVLSTLQSQLAQLRKDLETEQSRVLELKEDQCKRDDELEQLRRLQQEGEKERRRLEEVAEGLALRLAQDQASNEEQSAAGGHQEDQQRRPEHERDKQEEQLQERQEEKEQRKRAAHAWRHHEEEQRRPEEERKRHDEQEQRGHMEEQRSHEGEEEQSRLVEDQQLHEPEKQSRLVEEQRRLEEEDAEELEEEEKIRLAEGQRRHEVEEQSRPVGEQRRHEGEEEQSRLVEDQQLHEPEKQSRLVEEQRRLEEEDAEEQRRHEVEEQSRHGWWGNRGDMKERRSEAD
eukprot:TRINITY_DN1307_c0_g1_i4.p1 TRINITY_DN1307_c0_g1~~TRINITY_DN1307_c0_g1_i4.p1  ORF type:complete len:1167 (-),score=303.42 TRINITY_DN1307_c0_g1_i4:484-3942(-)